MEEKQKDLLGIGKTFKVEYLDCNTYTSVCKCLDDGELEPNILIGTLVNYTNPTVGQLFILDEYGAMNIIPFGRIISMIHLKEDTEHSHIENECDETVQI